MDISLNIDYPCFKFEIDTLHDIVKGTMSQIFDLGPSFHFM